MSRTIAVIGAGVSGLTVACELIQRSQRSPGGVEVICMESSDRPGGNIRSKRADGYTYEWGPTGFLDNSPATLTLIRRLELDERRVTAAPESETRYIYRKGKLRCVPTGPGSAITSGVLSPPGLLRLLGEPFARAARDDDESVFDFARRRIGREAASILVDAMVSGVYAGDTKKLSLRATFPRMYELETEYRGLFRAMLALRKKAKREGTEVGGPAGPRGKLTSFRHGMQELIDALVKVVGPRLRTNIGVRSISDMGIRGFRIHFNEGAPQDVDAVVLACPSWHAAGMVAEMDPEMAEAMEAIPSAPLAVVHFGYRAAALGDQPTGFGFLVPRRQGPRILGTLWVSDFFPERAPERGRLLTTMIGGAHDPGAARLPEPDLIEIARRDLHRIMGIATAPYFVRVIRHRNGIPQYTRGHLDRVATIQRRQDDHGGLWICGNSYHGISVNACIEQAPAIAEQALQYLTRSSNAAAL